MTEEPNDFYVTWRHVDQTPMEAFTHFGGTRREAERIQQRLLEMHASQCFYCQIGAGSVPGDNDRIVTRIRRYGDITRTVAHYHAQWGVSR